MLTFLGDSDAHIVRGPDRHPAHRLFRQARPGDSRDRRRCAVRAPGAARAPHAATLERISLHGGAHQIGCAGGARRSVSGSGFIARGRLIAAFAAVYLIWGSTFLALALGLQTIPPLLLMAARSIAAGAILLAIEQVRRPGFPPGRAWASAAVSGLLLFVGCHGTLAYAQQYVPSGLAAVMLATVPFWIVLLNVSAPHRSARQDAHIRRIAARPRRRRADRMALGSRAPAADRSADAGPAAGIGIFLGRRLAASRSASRPSPRRSPCRACSSCAAARLCSSAAGSPGELSRFSTRDVSAISWAGLAYLIGAGSVIGFTAYMWLLDHAPGPLVDHLYVRQSDHRGDPRMEVPGRAPDVADAGGDRAGDRLGGGGVAPEQPPAAAAGAARSRTKRRELRRAICGGGAAGPVPSAWRAGNARPRNSAPPSDSPAPTPTSRGIAPASSCTACANGA